MMSSNQITESAERDSRRAVSVSSFLAKIPSPLSNHVFRHIIDNGIKVGSVLRTDEVLRQLRDAIGSHYYESVFDENRQNLLIEFTGIPKDVLYAESSSIDREAVKAKIHESLKDLTPDGIPRLVLCQECFSTGDTGSLKDPICRKLLSVNESMNSDKNPAGTVTEYLLPSLGTPCQDNVFEELGYQTFLSSWADSKKENSRDDALFYSWYCRGEILDVVLDTIFDHEIPSVSRGLFAHLQEACRADWTLAEVANERISFLSGLDSRIPKIALEGGAKETVEHSEYIPALPEILETEGDAAGEPISQEQLGNLFFSLMAGGYVSPGSVTQFMAVFSGKGQYVKERIVWEKSQQTLAMFLYYANGKRTSDSYCRAAMKLFRRRNQGECSMETLSRRYPDKDKEMRNCFINAGIRR